jgi:Fe-S cluster assembly iron-binding protein IscA
MAVSISEAARERVNTLRAQPDSQGDWLRIGVRGGGLELQPLDLQQRYN